MTANTTAQAYRLREVQPTDLDTVVYQRHRMFVDAGRPDNDLMRERSAAFRGWLVPRLDDGRYYGWMIEHGGRAVAGLGMMTVEWAPHPMQLEPMRGYILNVYTEPAHRRRGLSRQLTQRAIDEARTRGLHVLFLHATDEGRLVYEQAGFKSRNEMQLIL